MSRRRVRSAAYRARRISRQTYSPHFDLRNATASLQMPDGSSIELGKVSHVSAPFSAGVVFERDGGNITSIEIKEFIPVGIKVRRRFGPPA